MNVLDPFEVLEIEMWPLWALDEMPKREAGQVLNAVEYSVYRKIVEESKLKAILNEKNIVPAAIVELPHSVRTFIVPEDLRGSRQYPDVRIARRASTISSLAKVISERDVSPGLRRTLVTQSRRLERLASTRFDDFAGDPIETDSDE